MNSLFYLAMLIGVGWLMIWAILPPERRGQGWWPFDMRDDGVQTMQDGEEEATSRRSVRVKQRNHAAIRDAGVTRQQASADSTPRSWRDRRTRS